jgi:hypothetical protein
LSHSAHEQVVELVSDDDEITMQVLVLSGE